jgi:hypothetical protein
VRGTNAARKAKAANGTRSLEAIESHRLVFHAALLDPIVSSRLLVERLKASIG